MTDEKREGTEETLDPSNWQELRGLAHRMVDDMITFLEHVRNRPVWQPMPEEVKTHFKEPLPLEPEGAESAYEDFLQFVQPYPYGNLHPRHWGWVNGTGTPLAMMAEMLASGLNNNMAFGEQAAIYVESQVLEWCKTMLGYPVEASGILVSGGSMANLVGLTVARNAKAGFDIAQEGIQHLPHQMVLYGSSEMHNSIQKAVELLGLGNQALRRIPVNEQFQIDLSILEQTIAEDRAKGVQPFCVIGNAGTVNTGAIDNLKKLAELCHKEHLWFHVDGAFGALAALSPHLRPMLDGMEQADSLAFDLHKWMYLPYEAGCILVRHEEAHHQAFSPSGVYLTPAPRGITSARPRFSEYGVQLSRSFKALKVWMSIKAHGIETYGRLIQQNVDQARYLAKLVQDSPELELMAPVSLNIVCFRYVTSEFDDAQLNSLNQELWLLLQESGVAVPSYTVVNGKYAIRAAITNHRSRREDFEMMIHKVIELGRKLSNW